MARKKTMYAIYNKDGELVLPRSPWDGVVCSKQWSAWHAVGFLDDAAIRRAKRAGYTCVEVEIVRKVHS